MQFRLLCSVLALVAVCTFVPRDAAAFDSIWSLQTVDELGQGTHPNLSQMTETIAIRGVALNASTEYLPEQTPWGAPVWQVYVQAIDGASGGVAVFEGYFAGNQGDTLHAKNIEAGDIVDVTGFLGFHNGKTNINTRHGSVPLFEIEVVEKAAGMPAPIHIPSIAACNDFDTDDDQPGIDQYRRNGGERYQAQWCRLSDLRYVSGNWENDGEVIVTDDSGATLTLKLSAMGDFDGTTHPYDRFSATGLFDQEDTNTDGDFYDGYRLWIKRSSDIVVTRPAAAGGWTLYE